MKGTTVVQLQWLLDSIRSNNSGTCNGFIPGWHFAKYQLYRLNDWNLIISIRRQWFKGIRCIVIFIERSRSIRAVDYHILSGFVNWDRKSSEFDTLARVSGLRTRNLANEKTMFSKKKRKDFIYWTERINSFFFSNSDKRYGATSKPFYYHSNVTSIVQFLDSIIIKKRSVILKE